MTSVRHPADASAAAAAAPRASVCEQAEHRRAAAGHRGRLGTRAARAPGRIATISGCRRDTGASRSLTTASDRLGRQRRQRRPARCAGAAASPAAAGPRRTTGTPRRRHAERRERRARPTVAARRPAGRFVAAAEAEGRAARPGRTARRRPSAARQVAQARRPTARRAHSRSSPTSAAAASALPPPSPPCAGIRFVDAHARRAARRAGPAACQTSRAAFHTRFRSSSGTPGARARDRQSAAALGERQRVVQRQRLEDRLESRDSRRGAAPRTARLRLILARARGAFIASPPSGPALPQLVERDRRRRREGTFTANTSGPSGAFTSTCDSASRGCPRPAARRSRSTGAGPSAGRRPPARSVLDRAAPRRDAGADPPALPPSLPQVRRRRRRRDRSAPSRPERRPADGLRVGHDAAGQYREQVGGPEVEARRARRGWRPAARRVRTRLSRGSSSVARVAVGREDEDGRRRTAPTPSSRMLPGAANPGDAPGPAASAPPARPEIAELRRKRAHVAARRRVASSKARWRRRETARRRRTAACRRARRARRQRRPQPARGRRSATADASPLRRLLAAPSAIFLSMTAAVDLLAVARRAPAARPPTASS